MQESFEMDKSEYEKLMQKARKEARKKGITIEEYLGTNRNYKFGSPVKSDNFVPVEKEMIEISKEEYEKIIASVHKRVNRIKPEN